jgi:hypothetical protein
MRPLRALPLALLASCLVGCGGETDSPDAGPGAIAPAKPRAVAVVPRDADGEFLWLQALDRSEVGDPVAPDIERAVFGEELALGLEDLYVELWHDGGALAQRLFDLVRDCDADARIRFGAPLVVARSELDPMSEAAIELRYLTIDPRGRAAAELLRDHLRTACSGAAHDALRAVFAEHGLALRAVPAFPYSGDTRNRSHLVLLVQPGPTVTGALGERSSEL